MTYKFIRKNQHKQNHNHAINKPVCIRQADPVANTIRPKLTVGAANDQLEQEADRVAEQVMSMSVHDADMTTRTAANGLPDQHSGTIRRSCISCQQEQEELQPKLKQPGSAKLTPAVESTIASLEGKGQSLSTSDRQFFEPRFQTDFSTVRIHQDSSAANAARSINARAFTLGKHIVLANGEYSGGSRSSRKLLAHELTHVIQQRSSVKKSIQRKKHRGKDNYGSFSLDDSTDKFLYRQKWFYKFHSGIKPAERPKLMTKAAAQVKQVWSNKFPLIPTPLTSARQCPSPKGASVEVDIAAQESKKKGRGVVINVVPKVRANVNPVSGKMTLEKGDFAGSTYSTGLQYTVAHEFGHTINLTDEYNGWSRLFVPAVEKDKTSIMNSGNSVHPRHYQYFGDLLSAAISGCRYNPNGIRQLERENAVLRASTLSGLTTYQDGVKIPGVNSKFSLGENYSLRVSNQRLFGLFYPHIGAIKLWNPEKEKPDVGFSTGVSLGQIAHPLTVNLNTGVVFNPMDPAKSIKIPVSLQVGLRTSKYEVGIHYTPVINLLPGAGVTHLFGIGGRF